tara:strand:- start:8507 stop:8707 length:201 start_codon:yes stop_codon:yes gene_type:complete
MLKEGAKATRTVRRTAAKEPFLKFCDFAAVFFEVFISNPFRTLPPAPKYFKLRTIRHWGLSSPHNL